MVVWCTLPIRCKDVNGFTEDHRLKTESPAPAKSEPRTTLTRQRVLEAAVALADRQGLDAVSMRRLGQELGIEAMSLYTHVRSKEDLLDGMVEVVLGQISVPRRRDGWKETLRRMILNARGVMLRHPWAPAVIETRVGPGASGLRHYDRVMGILREGGFSLEMTHHAIHLLGSRLLGFTQDLFDDSPTADDAATRAFADEVAETHPYVAEMALGATHDGALGGCDDDLEFAFALDVILDGLEALRQPSGTIGR
jgi:AcrR family transcriptional regulator